MSLSTPITDSHAENMRGKLESRDITPKDSVTETLRLAARMEIERDRVSIPASRLLSLLESPELGLATWQQCLQNQLSQLKSALNSLTR